MLQRCLTAMPCPHCTQQLWTETFTQLTKFGRNLQWRCVQLIWSPVTLSHSFTFFLWNIFFAFAAKNSVRASAAGLANVWHACPKLHLERYSLSAAFTAVPRVFFIYFARPGFAYCVQFIYIYTYTGCPRRNVPDFGTVFLVLNYTDITQNTYIQSWTVTEIIAREKCGLHRSRRTVRRPWRHTCLIRLPDN